MVDEVRKFKTDRFVKVALSSWSVCLPRGFKHQNNVRMEMHFTVLTHFVWDSVWLLYLPWFWDYFAAGNRFHYYDKSSLLVNNCLHTVLCGSSCTAQKYLLNKFCEKGTSVEFIQNKKSLGCLCCDTDILPAESFAFILDTTTTTTTTSYYYL